MINYTSKIAIGTANFGLDYGINNSAGKLEFHEITNILDHASSYGIDTIDTAQVYGTSEDVLGRYFENCTKDFRVITKLQIENQNVVSKKLDNSLAKLKLQKLYGCLFHTFKNFEDNPKSLFELQNFRQKGLIEKIGFSLYYPDQLQKLFSDGVEFQLLQIPYNIFDRRFEPYFSELSDRNIEIHVRSVFLQGLVFKKELPYYFSPIKPKLLKLQEIARNSNIEIQTLCLNFVISNNLVTRTVLGIDNLAQLTELINIARYSERISNLNINLNELNEINENMIVPLNWPKNI